MDAVCHGQTLREVCSQPAKDGSQMPSPRTVYRWVRNDEELFKAWQATKELRAHSLFDEAIDLAHELAYMPTDKLTQQKVRALDVAIATFRDAASRLNPSEYAQKRTGDVVVPIQIVTNMDLGQTGKTPVGNSSDAIYEIIVPARLPGNPDSSN